MNTLENSSKFSVHNKKRENFFLPMDPSRGRQQHSYRCYKSSNCQRRCHFGNNNYSMPSNQGYLRTTRIQKSNLKWRKGDQYKGSYRSGHPYRKVDASGRKSNKSAEDVEEEERKKKLNDTAKKLLSKIETWNAEKNVSEEFSKNKGDPQVVECDSGQGKEKTDGNSKKRIAHSEKPKLVKNRTPKKLKKSPKKVAKYDVNKATVKDFQNRIQHKLIEEIMQMPKENLQSVLNDPKINPVMGLKMSRLVQENRPLITQKLRALAESKMKSLGFTSNQQLLVDIDKLIDPVIETDLSALPYELIKQMENLFQVQFDYSHNGSDACQVGIDICDSAEGNPDQEMVTEINSLEPNDKLQNNLFKEDLSLYECSTDEDEEIIAVNSEVSSQPHNMSPQEDSDAIQYIREEAEDENDIAEKNKIKMSGILELSDDCDSDPHISEDLICKEGFFPPEENQPEEEFLTFGNLVESTDVSEEPIQVMSPSAEVFPSAFSQTEGSLPADASTQTPSPSHETGILYGVSLPKESKDGNSSSLLEEVNAIQTLINKLNERRLMIFLELSRLNPGGDFVRDNKTKESFREALSNGSVYLMDALEEFFKSRSRQNYENPTSSSRKWQSSGKWVNKSKFRSREER